MQHLYAFEDVLQLTEKSGKLIDTALIKHAEIYNGLFLTV